MNEDDTLKRLDRISNIADLLLIEPHYKLFVGQCNNNGLLMFLEGSGSNEFYKVTYLLRQGRSSVNIMGLRGTDVPEKYVAGVIEGAKEKLPEAESITYDQTGHGVQISGIMF